MSSKYNKLAGKNVLVIGGSSGIGYGVAEAALAAGANVSISSSSQARLDSAAAALEASLPAGSGGGRIAAIRADLSRADTIEADLEALFAAAPAPTDHIVFTASDALSLGGLDDVNAAQAHRAAHMRMVVPLLLGKVARRHLAPSRHASLTLTTGSVAVKPAAGWALIGFMGGGIQTLTKALAVDLAPVRVNAVRPGVVDTGLWDHSMSGPEKAAMLKELGDQALTGCAGRVEDVAEAYLWLMKDGNVTGFVAGTDGGALLV